MNTRLETLINSEVWNNPDLTIKRFWQFLTEGPLVDDIRESLQQIDKDVRVAAFKQARTEYVGWIKSMMIDDPDIHEADVRDACAVNYWLRVAEIAGVPVTFTYYDGRTLTGTEAALKIAQGYAEKIKGQ